VGCKGLHCPGCGQGGGGPAALLVVLGVVLVAAIARPVVHAAEVVLEVTLITVSSVAGLAVLGGAAYGAARLHHWQARNRQTIPRPYPYRAARASGAFSAAAPRDRGPAAAPGRTAVRSPRHHPHRRKDHPMITVVIVLAVAYGLFHVGHAHAH